MRISRKSSTFAAKLKRSVGLIAWLCCSVMAFAASNGELKGRFIIGKDGDGEDIRVCFSQGNLRFDQSANTWSFAEHQYDVLGAANYDGDKLANTIDLFGWSADDQSAAKYGVSTDPSSISYMGYFQDWGANRISNGGNKPGVWRTLTADEWKYLIENNPKGPSKVNGIDGIVLVPYNMSFTIADSYTAEEWAAAEAQGLVFLPYSGHRNPTDLSVEKVAESGWYWTATNSGTRKAKAVECVSGNIGLITLAPDRSYGCSVRLVQNKGKCEVTVTATAEPEQGTITITVLETDN